ncbi:MAG TPA: M23 family metallopeptidase [Acidimicrobiia bacterium]|jgi:hypothetical protein|nr:M23 family metallopeptidase [Acidimicrobiia bacterium]
MTSRHLLVALAALLAAAQILIGPGASAPAEAAEAVSLTCFPHEPTDMVYHDTWGAARSGGRGHRGTDIMSPKGTEVRAVADGWVETLKSGPRSGYYIRLVHEGDWESWYMHLNNDTAGTDDGRGGADAAYAEGLDEGIFVRAGQVIGYVGDSGNAEWTGSHTHFELHINGRAVNPYPYLVDVDEASARLIDLVSSVATLPAHEVGGAASGELWGELVAASTVDCLPDSLKNVIQHLFGELPSEGVLLTRVITR